MREIARWKRFVADYREALREFVLQARRAERSCEGLERLGVDSRLVEAMALGGRINSEALAEADLDRNTVSENVQRYLEMAYPAIHPAELNWDRDEEHDTWRLTTESYEAGVIRRVVFDRDFLASADYRRLIELSEESISIGDGPFRMVSQERSEEIPTGRLLLQRILEIGARGQYIQRYKGLGEMNSEQLWETTMDPDARTFLQVQIEDGVEADETFSLLMGDAVEPRKQFIERNALNVTNLDI